MFTAPCSLTSTDRIEARPVPGGAIVTVSGEDSEVFLRARDLEQWIAALVVLYGMVVAAEAKRVAQLDSLFRGDAHAA